MMKLKKQEMRTEAFQRLYLPLASLGYRQRLWSASVFAVCFSHHRWFIALHPHSPLVALCHFFLLFFLFRKCWTSVKTEGAVKSLSTAVCLGWISAPVAANTSLSGTNAGRVSPSLPSFLKLTHIVFLYSQHLRIWLEMLKAVCSTLTNKGNTNSCFYTLCT